MTAQEVAKKVMKTHNVTQADVAKECGLSGQTSVSMWFSVKSMSVDKLLKILGMCGYELIAVDRGGDGDSYRISEGSGANDVVDIRIAQETQSTDGGSVEPEKSYKVPEQDHNEPFGKHQGSSDTLEDLIRRVVQEELSKR